MNVAERKVVRQMNRAMKATRKMFDGGTEKHQAVMPLFFKFKREPGNFIRRVARVNED